MILQWLRNKFRKDDNGVSPVVGTILMVAATVAIGATVFAALGAFGGESIEAGPTGVWTAKAVDTNGNGITDAVRLTYVSGPSGLADGVVQLRGLTNMTTDQRGSTTTGPTWSPGDFVVYGMGTTAGSHSITVSVNGKLLLEQTIRVDE